MYRHYKGIGLLLLAIVVAVVSAYWLDQAIVAYAILVGSLVLLFVLGVAYMRPKGRTPEHHAKIDKLVDDKRP